MEEGIIIRDLNPDSLHELVKNAVNSVISETKQKEILNVTETAALLNISRSTLNKLKTSNRIPYRKIGKRVLFSRSDVLASLKEDPRYRRVLDLRK